NRRRVEINDRRPAQYVTAAENRPGVDQEGHQAQEVGRPGQRARPAEPREAAKQKSKDVQYGRLMERFEAIKEHFEADGADFVGNKLLDLLRVNVQDLVELLRIVVVVGVYHPFNGDRGEIVARIHAAAENLVETPPVIFPPAKGR